MPFLKFTVDSRLLEELGERLVGKPYIALAELVKNSYDADATEVTIELDPKNDLIRIVDNGQGMTFEEFETFWMRVGSTHKQRQEISKSLRQFKRPLTGSKGIGRLAVQYLAGELTILSTSEKDRTRRIEAHVKWEEAVSAGELTQSRVQYDIKTSKEFPIRTSIVLTKLKQKWDQSSVKGLAKEIWWLRPAFSRDSGGPAETEGSFTIGFTSPNPEFKDFFERQMQAILDIWYAKLLGRNNGGVVALTLEFAGKDRVTIDYSIPPPCRLKDGSFEIRIYKLEGKLRGGLKIGDVRQYLAEFGGVHVYDSGFHLPYYGKPENDWLRVEFDHSHRLSISALLPGPLQVEGGMSYLPTLSRILGVVNVNTSKDRGLQILITRDRFQESVALGNLVYMVRWALDFYAIQEANKIERSLELAKDTEKPKYRRIEDVLAHYRSEIPPKDYDRILADVKQVTEKIESESEAIARRVSYFGPLATAGITSLAYQHELRQHFAHLQDFVSRIEEIEKQPGNEKVRQALAGLKDDLASWLERAEMTNAIFAYFNDADNLKTRKRFRAKTVVDEIKEQVKVLARGIPINTDEIEEDLLLPKASLLEWSSIFQNVFINAFNAMLDSEVRLIQVSSRRKAREREILVQDTGIGVDLREAGKLFEPFERRATISPERRAIGYGGTGLGLTIVRLVARNIGCDVSFAHPDKGFRTAFSLKWRESE